MERLPLLSHHFDKIKELADKPGLPSQIAKEYVLSELGPEYRINDPLARIIMIVGIGIPIERMRKGLVDSLGSEKNGRGLYEEDFICRHCDRWFRPQIKQGCERKFYNQAKKIIREIFGS